MIQDDERPPEVKPGQYFVSSLLRELRTVEPHAAKLEARFRGKTVTLGVADAGDWVPLLRLTHPSSSFNVMSLEVRHHAKWAPTHVRGIPHDIAEALLGPLAFTWLTDVVTAEEEKPNSDPQH